MGAQVSRGSGAAAKRKKYKGHLIQTLDDHEGGVNCMSLSEDCSVLATGMMCCLLCNVLTVLNYPCSYMVAILDEFFQCRFVFFITSCFSGKQPIDKKVL